MRYTTCIQIRFLRFSYITFDISKYGEFYDHATPHRLIHPREISGAKLEMRGISRGIFILGHLCKSEKMLSTECEAPARSKIPTGKPYTPRVRSFVGSDKYRNYIKWLDIGHEGGRVGSYPPSSPFWWAIKYVVWS